MATTVGSLLIDMQANVARLAQDMGEAKRVVNSAAREISSAAEFAKGALSGIAGGLSAGGIVTMLKASIDAADSLNDLSQKVGISVDVLAGYKLAAEQSGTSLEGLAQGVKKLSIFMVDHGDKLNKVGIVSKDVNVVLTQLSDIFASLPDGAQKTALAVALFGKSGSDLIPLLNGGAAALEESRKKSEKYAEKMKELAPLADEFNDRLAELKLYATASGTALNGLLKVLNPLLEEMAKTASQASSSGSDFNVLGETLRALVVLGGNVKFVFHGVGNEIGGIAAQINALASGDFSGFLNIGAMMKKDAEDARTEFDKWEERMMNLGKNKPSQQNSKKPPMPETEAAGKANALKEPEGRIAGKGFLEELAKRIEKVGKDEYAMLRLEAAQKGVAASAEPLIKKLKASTEAHADRVMRMEAELRATDRLIEQMNKKDFYDPGKVEDFIKVQQEAIDQIEFETTLIGKTAQEVRELTEARKMDLAAQKLSLELGEEATEDLFKRTDQRKKKMIDAMRAEREAGREWQTGMSDAINRYLDDVTNAAQQSAMLFGNAFHNMEDALVNFVKTGKLDFKSLADSIITDIIRINIQRNVMAPLVGDAKNPGILTQGLGNIMGGFKSLFGFANGGDFTVGGAGGTDSQLVAFRATPGESVSVRTPGQQGGSAPSVVVQVINQSGQPMTARSQGAPQFNGADWVLGVVLEASQTNPNFRAAMGMAR